MHRHASARYAVPRRVTYRSYYTRWYVHPYYRYQYSTTMVVGFGFVCNPWVYTWAPPYRPGWSWVGGYWAYGVWIPGYWSPRVVAPRYYVYVPGYWDGDAYVEGYYRREARDGWEWVDGYYLDDGTYVRGYWIPEGNMPDGYTWEPGFYDGESWIDGFWRPEFRSGFTWVSSYFDEGGIFHSGYWMPLDESPGQVWVPGWFDGNEWVPGYWVDEAEYGKADLENWTPEEGWDEGWEAGSGVGEGEVLKNLTNTEEGAEEEIQWDELPLALPVLVDEEPTDLDE